MYIALSPSDALIVVDMQNDFMPGGTLAVPGADQIIPVINTLIPCFATRVFTRDWHPANHISFGTHPSYTDYSWPPHCVQNTPGAEIVAGLDLSRIDLLIDKASRPDRESYSDFDDSNLAEWLRERNVHRVFICGVATDYCVKATALDAVKEGFQTFVVLDAVRAVHAPEGSNEAVAAMRTSGVEMIFSQELLC
jgi:nicotinamidase/pyrazinamidase